METHLNAEYLTALDNVHRAMVAYEHAPNWLVRRARRGALQRAATEGWAWGIHVADSYVLKPIDRHNRRVLSRDYLQKSKKPL
jgi:hypothetical protein